MQPLDKDVGCLPEHLDITHLSSSAMTEDEMDLQDYLVRARALISFAHARGLFTRPIAEGNNYLATLYYLITKALNTHIKIMHEHDKF